MIEVTISGKCRGCPACELDISRMLSGIVQVEATVYCRNSRLCDHLERFIEARLLAAEQADEK